LKTCEALILLVGLGGLEPQTSSMSTSRSEFQVSSSFAKSLVFIILNRLLMLHLKFITSLLF
jgi:hypothetical protein